MKNSIYFDETFTPELLVNEESDPQGLRNTVWLIFKTDSGASPRLEITVRTAAYTVELIPNTEYEYQLPGQYWAAGGITSIRLVSNGVPSEYIYITFPEIISTDAALCESEEQENAYFIQGKNDEAAELRTETIKYANGRDYYLTQLQRIVEFIFACKNENATALLTCTICFTASGIADEADVTVRIRVNRIFDEIFVPVQTVKNGKHVITICYPVSDISNSTLNQVDVYIETSDGELEILQGKALATLTASGLATSSRFTGLIELLDYATTFDADQIFVFIPAAESPSVELQVPVGATLSDNVQNALLSDLSIADQISDNVFVINYELEHLRTLEDEETERVTENGADYRYTEREHS